MFLKPSGLILLIIFISTLCQASDKEQWGENDNEYDESKVWDSFPHLKLKFRWSGGDNANQEAEGNGNLYWFNIKDELVSHYKGEMKNGKKHGSGEIIYQRGSRYIGQWNNNKKNGFGEYFYESGDYYRGEYRDGRMHGDGFYITNANEKYIGEFRNGKRVKNNTNKTQRNDISIGLSIDHKFQKKYDKLSQTGIIPFSIRPFDSHYVVEPNFDEWGKWKANEAPKSDISEFLTTPIAFLSVRIKNNTSKKIHINGGNIFVKKSRDDKNIYLITSKPITNDFFTKLYFENLGAKIKSCDFKYSIKGDNEKEFSFSQLNIPFKYKPFEYGSGGDFGILDLTKSYQELGVDLPWLKKTGDEIERNGGSSENRVKLRNNIKGKVKLALGKLAPSKIEGDFSIYSVDISGTVKCNWNSKKKENNDTFEFSDSNFLYVATDLGSGSGEPVSAKFGINFAENKENYNIPFSLEAEIHKGKEYRFVLDLGAKYNSIHDFSVGLDLVSGQTIETKPVKFHHFNGSTQKNPRGE